MLGHRSVIVLCLAVFSEAAQADVTLRYQWNVTVNPGLPPEFKEELVKTFGSRLPPKYTQHFKNGKLHFSYEDDEAIVDFDKREITLLEGETKRYSVISIEQYLKEVVGVPVVPAQTSEKDAALHSHSESIITGRTAFVSGVESEERNILITVDTSASTLPVIRVVVHAWRAKETEVMRLPALGELAPYQIRIFEVADPAGPLGTTFRQMPGLADGFASLTESFRPEDTVTRLTMDFFVPTLGALARELKVLPAGVTSPLGEGFDPDAAFVEVTQELTTMSSEPIPDSVFAVPANYRAVTLAELMAGN